MNTDTGELRHFQDDSQEERERAIRAGFIPLTNMEARIAEMVLAGQESTVLPPDHPLRMRVTKRVGRPATQGQLRAIGKHLRTMGTEAFWEWMKENCPDITPTEQISCGQAQRVLTMLDQASPAVMTNTQQ